ncbi:hypothetical protein CVT26_002284 [Gymnopilus dilepis]|uniref:MARVEL domain-containing protein n=1 Tax=Gymnopilus dilepis TaxID=231916 RepID=A0A409YN09_9AGAR|nr:hypothetical protein CVT26_002284 [Gymnopilus dilepis]
MSSSISMSSTIVPSLSILPSSTSLTPTPTPSFPPTSPSTADRLSYLSTTTTGLIACLTIMLALMYLVVFSWSLRYMREGEKKWGVNKGSGVVVGRWAPVGYAFLVLSSLTEVALSSWLILQWKFNHNFPNAYTRAGTRLILFASSWTTLTASTYTVLFTHPSYSRHPISSIGAQAIWAFLTWLFWVVGAGVVNASIPGVIDRGACREVAYCVQIRGMFGVAVLER